MCQHLVGDSGSCLDLYLEKPRLDSVVCYRKKLPRNYVIGTFSLSFKIGPDLHTKSGQLLLIFQAEIVKSTCKIIEFNFDIDYFL